MFKRTASFMRSAEDLFSAGAVILGAPLDLTTTFRSGTRLGPESIRQVSESLEEYSPGLDRDLSDYKYYDTGDVILPQGLLEESLKRIKSAAGTFLRSKKFLLTLGGEHLISLPVIEAAHQIYPGLAVLHFDAHADFRDEYLGVRLSHATVMRRVAEVVGGGSVFQLGIRSGSRQEMKNARSQTNFYDGEIIPALKEIIPAVSQRPVYVTLDIDVIDPAYAPGTGAPEPCGCTPGEIIQALYLLKDMHVVGMDLVEVSPACDPSWRTSILAAKLVREAILLFTT
ncbi:MAG TPA: agmatinase [Desulfotomaculum sp.]|nr:MAG: Agmatinase [Desulfotomaculum sp. 46_80]HBY03118.1 agmatinase [Desulfotomaculum sp.]